MEYSGTWKEIWEQKGEMSGTKDDIRIYNGWEKSDTSIKEIADKIYKILDIQPSDKMLEVGCGAGALSEYFNCNYFGIDISSSLIKKCIEFYGKQCMVAEAADLPFKDGYFDKVFSWGVFLYFNDKDYAARAINEMLRVLKPGGTVFIGELAKTSHQPRHCLFSETDFDNWNGWDIIPGWASPYQNIRFNIVKRKAV
jgi:ubiquinone/menaquinone biosynthesis C-methylase UbiE